MYKSNVKYTNRNGKWYNFLKHGDSQLLFTIEDFGHGRMGSKEGQESVDRNDLGMFDPSGGPYVALGTKVDGREIVKISWHEDGFLLLLDMK